MNEYSSEVWKHAPVILEKFEDVWKDCGPRDFSEEKRNNVKDKLLALLLPPEEGEDTTSGEKKASVEDFEYALQTAVMSRLETSEERAVLEVVHMLEITAAAVVEVFSRAARGSPSADTDRCKAWWTMFFLVAEDVARLIPARLIDQLVGSWEDSLVRLRAGYLQLAAVRLAELDAKVENEQKKLAEESAEGSKDKDDGKEKKEKDDAKEKKEKEAKEKELATKRVEERKKLITSLWISPNGQLYLTLTSLLKQLASRLAGSTQAAVRARIVLLLEELLAMDHKAIANNQKTKTQDIVQTEDLDELENATAIIANEPGRVSAAGESSSLGTDPEVDGAFYRSLWRLQESLQYPERIADKADTWKPFQQVVSKLLGLFKKYPVQDPRRQPWTEPEPMPLRMAPRADALRAQLDDPTFRQQLLTQILIAFQALEQDASTKLGLHPGLIHKERNEKSDKSSKHIKDEFEQLKKACEAALEQTRPGFTKMLKHVLEREAHWLEWKGFGCREFERESMDMLFAKATPYDALGKNLTKEAPAKPKLAPHIQSMLKTLRDPQWKVSTAVETTDSEEAAKQMQTGRLARMCEANMDTLIDEDKPENDIEDEYKKKRNKVYMWQSRRLFCQQYLDIFAKKENHNKQDFMEFVSYVRDPPKPAATTAEGEKAAAQTAVAPSGSPEGEEGEPAQEDEPMQSPSPVPEGKAEPAAEVAAEQAAGEPAAAKAADTAEPAPEGAAEPAPAEPAKATDAQAEDTAEATEPSSKKLRTE